MTEIQPSFASRFRLWALLLMGIPFLPAAAGPGGDADSLRRIAESPGRSDEPASLACAALSELYKGKNTDSSIYYAERALDLAKKSGSPRALVRSYLALGSCYLAMDSLERAQTFHLSATEHFGPGADTADLVAAYRGLGTISTTRSDYYPAMTYMLKAVALAERTRDSSALARTYNNMGIIEDKVGLADEALGHYRLALSYLGTGEEMARGYVLGNIGIIHFGREEADSAIYYMTLALEMAERTSDQYSISNQLVNLGNVELELQDNPRAAMEYYRRALQVLDRMDSTDTRGFGRHNRAKALYNMGRALAAEKRYREAMDHYKESLALSSAIGMTEMVAVLYQNIAALYEAQGRADSAMTWYRKHIEHKESMTEHQAVGTIRKLLFEVQLENEREMYGLGQQLEEERTRRRELRYLLVLVVIGSLLAGAATLLLLYRSRLMRQALARRNAELERKKLEDELSVKLLSLVQKNNLIRQMLAGMQDVLGENTEEQQKALKNLFRELRAEGERDLSEDFEHRFREVNHAFYGKLVELYPALSPNERRLCTYLYLGMSTKEIAAITMQRPDTLNTARHRLRKKLGIDADQDILSFLHGL